MDAQPLDALNPKYELSPLGYWRVWQRYWEFVRPYRAKFILIFLLLLISVPLAQFAVFLTRDVTNKALLAIDETIAERWGTVLAIVGLQAGMWFLSSVLSTMREVLEWYTSMRSTFDLRLRFYRHLHHLPLSFLSTRPPGEHLYRSTADFGQVDGDGYDPGVMGMICRQAPQLAEQAYSLVWGGIFLYFIDPVLAGLLACYMVPYVLVGWVLYDQVRRSSFRMRHRAELETAVLRDSIAGLRTVKSMGRTALQIRRYMGAATATRRRGMQLLWWQTTADHFGLWGVRWVFNALMSLYITYRVLSGQATVGDWLATVALIAAAQVPLERFFLIVQKIRLDMVPAQRILETLDVPINLKDPENPTILEHVDGRIQFDRVTFGYDPDRPVLHDLSLAIEPGESVGFVGPSGAGKSSLLNLALRLYPPSSGSILIDSHDLSTLKLDAFLAMVGVVPQSTYLYDGTIEDNIRFGNRQASNADVAQAVRLSGLEPLIARRQEGLEAMVGEGATVSGGERQRIGIARALVRDPRVLILDEATANLDPTTEAAILETIREISPGRTVLTVAHRLKAVRHCDRIVVLESGRIVETGTHDALLRADGLYARLWREQNEIPAYVPLGGRDD